MKNFLTKTLLFSLFILLFILLLQVVLSVKINNKSTTGHDNLDITSNVNAELILMGSSRCWAHFDPFFFEKEFNLKSTNIGVDGHSQLSMAYVRLTDYLKHNTPPKYAIISFDPFNSAGDTSKKSTNKVHKDNFARYAYVPLNDDWETINYFGYNNWEKYFPLYAVFKYKQVSNCLFQNNTSRYMKYGYERNDKIGDTIKNPLDNTLMNYYSSSTQELEIKTALSQLNDLCSANGIKLICIQTPVYKSIYDKKLFEMTKRISTSLDLLFVDANYTSIRTETKYFYNSNHLNIKGVTAMNNKLKKELELIKALE